MYLKEIQTYGFKSFADKMNFEFTNNINGIVGPNGSGKSNVVDAVRWVLGEQSNKSLRAADNISVIFSGSKSRRPLNSAMVNIIFDNTDRHLPIDFGEVSIKRVLYRTGENEYYLNGEKCRLKDITELLTDSGAAKESFNIIGQGKIDEILTTKPYDRRVIFEEAAGVLKYKRRKEEAIRKLERTNNNINRVNDIINELETNLKPLEEQSSTAKKYLECKDKLTNYDISLMIYDVDTYSRELNLCKEEISALNDEISELSKNNANYDVTIFTHKEKLNTIEEKLTNYNQKVLELTKILEQTDSDLKLLRERKKYQDTDSHLDRITPLKESILSNKNTLNTLEGDIAIYEKKVATFLEELNDLQNKVLSLRNKNNSLTNEINNNTKEITNLKYQINYLEESINNGTNIPKSVKSLLNNPLFSGVYGTIGTLINTKNEYSLAVSTSMGGATNYLVVSDRHLASRMVEYLKDKDLGRATFFPLDVIRPRYIDIDTLNKLPLCEGYINTLDKVLEYDPKYENIILNQFGNVLLVDNISNANKISKIINNKYKIVTLDGQLVNVGGSITGGASIKTNDPIKQKYELSSYKDKLQFLLTKNNSLESSLTTNGVTLKEYEDKIHAKNIDKLNYQDIIDTKKNNLSKLSITISSLEKELSNLEAITTNSASTEETNLLNKYYKIKEELDNITKEISLTKIERDKINDDLKELENTSRTSTSNIAKLEKNLHDDELKSSRLEVKIDTILNSLN